MRRASGGFTELSLGEKRSEAQKTAAQVERIRDLGGLLAPILNQGTAQETMQYVRPQGGGVANDCDQSSRSWAQAHLYAVDHTRPAQPGARSTPCRSAPTRSDPVDYPFQVHAAPGLGVSGSFTRLETGSRAFDINVDGLANVGLLPDFVEDLKQVGVSDVDLEPLFRSAEGYVRMGERLEADADGDGVVDLADDCPTLANPGQADANGDGLGDACAPWPAAGCGMGPELALLIPVLTAWRARRRGGERRA